MKSVRGITASSIALVCLCVFIPSVVSAKCAADKVGLQWNGGSVAFTVEVRDTVDTRAEGLMHRESLAKFSGMLFVYDQPQPVAFWMRNTLIPLDMLFFDQAGALVRLHENAVPLDETAIPGGDAVQYVLEINGGLSRQLGIKPDAHLQHPAILADLAAWPCE